MKKTAHFILLFLSIAGVFLAGSWYGPGKGVSTGTPELRRLLHRVDLRHAGQESGTRVIAVDSGISSGPVHVHGQPADPGRSADPNSPGAVNISLEKQQLLGVRVSPVERAADTHTVRLLGRVAPDETRVYRVNAGIEGFIREVAPVTTGDHVRKDQLLATFSAPNALSVIQLYILNLGAVDRLKQNAAAGSVEAQAAPAGASNIQQRLDQLQNLGMSSLQMEEISRTRQAPASIKLQSPGDGVVLARNVTPDQKFERGAELFRIADLTRVWIVADVFENEAQYLQPGKAVTVSLPHQKRTFEAKVSSVRPQFDPTTRTLKVRLEAENPDDILRPDMFVDVELPITLPPALAVPVEAVVDSGLTKTVFVDRGEGRFEPRQVKTGARVGDRVEIVQGLTPGERIAVSGTFLLDSESRMKMAAPGATGHMHAGHAHHAEGPTQPASAPASTGDLHEGHMHPPATVAASDTASTTSVHDHSAHDHAGPQHTGHHHP